MGRGSEASILNKIYSSIQCKLTKFNEMENSTTEKVDCMWEIASGINIPHTSCFVADADTAALVENSFPFLGKCVVISRIQI